MVREKITVKQYEDQRWRLKGDIELLFLEFFNKTGIRIIGIGSMKVKNFVEYKSPMLFIETDFDKDKIMTELIRRAKIRISYKMVQDIMNMIFFASNCRILSYQFLPIPNAFEFIVESKWFLAIPNDAPTPEYDVAIKADNGKLSLDCVKMKHDGYEKTTEEKPEGRYTPKTNHQ